VGAHHPPILVIKLGARHPRQKERPKPKNSTKIRVVLGRTRSRTVHTRLAWATGPWISRAVLVATSCPICARSFNCTLPQLLRKRLIHMRHDSEATHSHETSSVTEMWVMTQLQCDMMQDSSKQTLQLSFETISHAVRTPTSINQHYNFYQSTLSRGFTIRKNTPTIKTSKYGVFTIKPRDHLTSDWFSVNSLLVLQSS